MIGIEFCKSHVEGLDGRDTNGRMFAIHVGPCLFMFSLTFGRKR